MCIKTNDQEKYRSRFNLRAYCRRQDRKFYDSPIGHRESSHLRSRHLLALTKGRRWGFFWYNGESSRGTSKNLHPTIATLKPYVKIPDERWEIQEKIDSQSRRFWVLFLQNPRFTFLLKIFTTKIFIWHLNPRFFKSCYRRLQNRDV